MIAARPDEIREPAPGDPRLVPFEERDDEYHVARDEQGIVYHKPSCENFRRNGWCEHLSNAMWRAKYPADAVAYEVIGLLYRWKQAKHDRPIIAVAGEIAQMMYVACEREIALNEWKAHVPLEGDALLERGREALKRHAGPSK